MLRRLFALLVTACIVVACGSHDVPPAVDAGFVPHKLGAVPTPVFPTAVDPPIVQDANFRIDKSYVSYVDGRIRAIEQVVIDQGTNGSNDDLSTVVSLPNANTTLTNTQWSFGTLILTGTLTATRTVTAPTSITTAPRKAIVNETAQSIVMAPATAGTSVTVPSLTSAWVVFDGTNFSLAGGGISGNATSIQSVPVSVTSPTALQVLASSDGTTWKPVSLTSDWVGSGFTPTLSFSPSQSSPIEIGTSISPTFTGSPLPNGAGVTTYTIADNQGGGPVSRLGSGSGFQGPSVSYALNAPATLLFTADVTQNGIGPKNATTQVVYQSRFFCFVDSHADADNAIASGTSATLRHSTTSYSGSVTSALTGSIVGSVCSVTPSSQYWYGLYYHQSGTRTFVDANTTFGFSASLIGTFSFTTGTGATVSYDLYRSDFLLPNNNFAVKVTG